MTTYKITLTVKLSGGHPSNWIPQAIEENLEPMDNEKLIDFECEELDTTE